MSKKILSFVSKYLFNNVIDFDLKAMYPSIQSAFNIDRITQYGKILFANTFGKPTTETNPNHISDRDFINTIIARDDIRIAGYFNLPDLEYYIEKIEKNKSKYLK